MLLLQNNYACLDLEEREVCLGVAPKAGLTSFSLEGDEESLRQHPQLDKLMVQTRVKERVKTRYAKGQLATLL